MQPAQPQPRKRTRPPRALVVRDPTPEEIESTVDWSPWYLTDEADMGHSPEHGAVSAGFHALVVAWLRERGREDLRAGWDEFYAWVEGEPLVRVSPDVLVHVAPPPPWPRSWTSHHGHPPPIFALEIVSEEWRKDYDDNPPKYAQLGCRELVIFDPDAARGVTRVRERVPLQVYRRDPDGLFLKVYQGAGPCRSEELDAWLVAIGDRPVAALRIALDASGKVLFPSPEERAASAETRAATAETRAATAETRAATAETRAATAESRAATIEARLAAERREKEAALARLAMLEAKRKGD